MGRYKEYIKSPDALNCIPERSRQRILKRHITNNFRPSLPCNSSESSKETSENGNRCDVQPTEVIDEETDIPRPLPSQNTDSDDCDDSDFEDANSFHDDNTSQENLYAGSKISLTESKVLILAFIHRYNLSKRATEDLQELINFHVPAGLNLQTSFYKLQTYLPSVQDYSVRHYYCQNCQEYLNGTEKTTCENCTEKVLPGSPGQNFFITFDLQISLKAMLESPDVQKYLSERRNEVIGRTETYQDITDGENYKQLAIRFPNFSGLLNTDGISVFNSSNFQLWPVFVSVNELSYFLRRKYSLICGLWFGSRKPKFSTFLFPVVKLLNELYTGGLQWNLLGEKIVSKFIFPILACDSPARSSAIGMVNHNGKASCPWCLHPGETMWLNEKSHKRIMKHRRLHYDRRTKINFLESLKVLQNKLLSRETVSSQDGISEASQLLLHKNFDVVDWSLYDYMHSALLGVVRYFTIAWFDSKNSSEPYYIGTKSRIIDQRCQTFSVPSTCSRSVRAVSEMNYWKAKEWRLWMLIFSHVLNGVLSDQYVNHFKKFCSGILLLLQAKVQANELDEASNFLNSFSEGVSGLYGDRFYTFNLHISLHAPEVVRKWGPLWCYSTFQFEHRNGQILRMINGTYKVGVELCNNLTKEYCLQSAIRNFTSNAINSYCYSVLSGSKFYRYYRAEGEIVLLGQGKIYYINDAETKIITDLGIFIAGNVKLHSKFIFKGLAFSTFKPGRRRYCDSIIACSDSVYLFKGILVIPNSNGSQRFLLKCNKINMNSNNSKFVKKVTNISSNAVFLDVNSVRCEKFVVMLNDNHHVTHVFKLPNCIEVD